MASTIRDVAKQAGVSISTVSRVLNNTCAVAEDKRERVEKAAVELGYVPNPNARSLLMKSTGGIGILLPHVSGEFFSEFLTGLDEVAKNNDFFLLISASHHRASEWQSSVQSVYKRVDGLIVMAPQLTPRQLNLVTDVPTVFVNTPVAPRGSQSADIINFDNLGGTKAATEYLIGLGHRKLAYVAGPERAYDARERVVGFEAAMTEAGIEDYTIIQAGYVQETGRAAAIELLGMDELPTGIVVANDYCALGLASELMSAGVRIPEDVSVIGFDNVPSAAFARPSLTTLSVPIRDVGIRALEMLIRRIRLNDDGPGRTVNLPVELVVRETTSKPRAN